MIRPSGKSAIVGVVALATALAAAGCGSSASSSGSGSTQNSSFRTCLEQHGISLPHGGSSSTPHPRPSGSRSASFQQAIKDCGGSGGFPGAG
jgi:hypothetical protein